MPARVIVLAGPSGAGKSRLADGSACRSCGSGRADVRGYDIPRNAMVGRRGLVVGHGHFIAEGIFAGERRKPPMVLLRRGLMLMRTEPAIIRRALDVGCIPLTPSQAETRLRRRLTGSAARRA